MHVRNLLKHALQAFLRSSSCLVWGQNTTEQEVLYPGWEPLDVFWPVRALILAGPVSAGSPPVVVMAPGQPPPTDLGFALQQPRLVATLSFLRRARPRRAARAPGGLGAQALEEANEHTPVEAFLRGRFFARLGHLPSVVHRQRRARGAAGLLDGRRATSNKAAWRVGHGARPERDVGAERAVDARRQGIDMMYAFLKHPYGENDPVLIATMNGIEYAPHTGPDWDPFSIVHNVPGHANGSMESCVRPVRFDSA
ncbi:hypothetical protein VTK26DRAFT_1735 [Humicola hyalothermophila]